MGSDFYMSERELAGPRLARANKLLDDTFAFLKNIKLTILDYDNPEVNDLIRRYADHVDNMRKA